MGKAGRPRGKTNKRKLPDNTVPFVSYFGGVRRVLGWAIVSERAFPEDRIELSPDGEPEIRSTNE